MTVKSAGNEVRIIIAEGNSSVADGMGGVMRKRHPEAKVTVVNDQEALRNELTQLNAATRESGMKIAIIAGDNVPGIPKHHYNSSFPIMKMLSSLDSMIRRHQITVIPYTALPDSYKGVAIAAPIEKSHKINPLSEAVNKAIAA